MVGWWWRGGGGEWGQHWREGEVDGWVGWAVEYGEKIAQEGSE